MIQHPIIESILSMATPKEVVSILAPLLTERRISRIDDVIDKRLGSVLVAIEAPSDIYNALAIVRTAEAFGITCVEIMDCTARKRRGWNTTLGTSQWTEVHYREDAAEQIKQMKRRGFSICGAVVDGALPLEKLDISGPVCLLFGNEERGLSDEAKELCDQRFTIPMRGMVESLNISVAAGIAIQSVVHRKGEGGDLSAEEKDLLRAAYYIRTIGFESATKIVETMKSKI